MWMHRISGKNPDDATMRPMSSATSKRQQRIAMMTGCILSVKRATDELAK